MQHAVRTEHRISHACMSVKTLRIMCFAIATTCMHITAYATPRMQHIMHNYRQRMAVSRLSGTRHNSLHRTPVLHWCMQMMKTFDGGGSELPSLGPSHGSAVTPPCRARGLDLANTPHPQRAYVQMMTACDGGAPWPPHDVIMSHELCDLMASSASET